MANEIKLEIYKFELKRYKSDLFLPLDSFFDKHDFKDFFVSYIKDIDKEIFLIGSESKTLQHHLTSLKFDSKSRILSGIVQGGTTGSQSKILDTKTGKLVFTKVSSHTDTSPYYFLISAPSNKKVGFIAIQRTGNNTIASPFLKHFRRYFRKQYPKVILCIDKYISTALVERFLGGNINEIIFTRTNAPADVADSLIKGHSNSSLNVKVTLSGLDSIFTNKVKRFMQNPNGKMFGVKALSDLGMDGNHRTRIKVKEGTETRTIDLKDSFNLNPYYYIDDEIEKDKNGEAVFSSIDEYTRKFIESLEDEIFD